MYDDVFVWCYHLSSPWPTSISDTNAGGDFCNYESDALCEYKTRSDQAFAIWGTVPNMFVLEAGFELPFTPSAPRGKWAILGPVYLVISHKRVIHPADWNRSNCFPYDGACVSITLMAVTPQTSKCHHNWGAAEVVVTFGSLWCHSHDRKRGIIFYSIMVSQN